MATTRIAQELMLGPVFSVELGGTETDGRATRTTYSLNVIDGWCHERESTDESGTVWEGGKPLRKAPVREVLDAAPDCAEFIAGATLRWVKILQTAGEGRKAAAQRRALEGALLCHGLELKEEIQQALAEHRARIRRPRTRQAWRRA